VYIGQEAIDKMAARATLPLLIKSQTTSHKSQSLWIVTRAL